MIRLALLLAALAAPVAAQDRAAVLIGSHHLGAAFEFEESNPGLFLTWDRDPVDLTVGVYRNSYGDASIAALASVPVITWDGGEAAVFGGVALYPGTGRTFAIHAGDVVPLVGITIRHRAGFAQIMPGDGYAADAVVAFGITFEIGDHP